MPRPKGGLGRGLGSLIPQGVEQPDEEAARQWEAAENVAESNVDPETRLTQSSVLSPQSSPEVPVESISPNPHQPRQAIQPNQLDELADSIREHGVLQPLVVTASEGGRYNLIAGERRWRAAMLAGLETVPVIVKEATSREMLEMALVENLQRADLNPLEEAAAYRSLVEDFGLKQEEVAARVGKSRTAVTNSLRLLRLPPQAQESLALGLIEAGHARAILQVPDEENQLRLLEQTVAEGLNVRQVEELARRLSEAANRPQEERATSKEDTELYDEVRAIEDRFREALGTRVQLSRSSRGGKLVIYFYSEEELGRIYGTIVGEGEG